MAGQTLHQLPHELGRPGLEIENVARDKDMPRAFSPGDCRRPVNCVETLLAEDARLIARKLSEGLADLPIGRMDESEAHD